MSKKQIIGWLSFSLFIGSLAYLISSSIYEMSFRDSIIIGILFFVLQLNAPNWWRFLFMPAVIHDMRDEDYPDDLN